MNRTNLCKEIIQSVCHRKFYNLGDFCNILLSGSVNFITMKYIAITLLLLFSNCCFAQNIVGIQVGIGACTSYLNRPLLPTPQFEGYFLRALSKHLALGISAGVDRYSFVQTNADPSNTTYEGVLSIKQQSTYLSLSPKADLGIGKRQRIHAIISVGLAKLIGGTQSADITYRDTHYGSYAGYYTRLVNFQDNSTININNLIQ